MAAGRRPLAIKTVPENISGNPMSPPPSTAVFIFLRTGLPFPFLGSEYGSRSPAKIPLFVWNCAIVIICLLFQTAYMSYKLSISKRMYA